MDHVIIHSFSTLAAGVGLGLAPLPGSDAPVLSSLQAAMIKALADRRGATMGRAAAAELALTLGATMAGRTLSQVALGWMPGVGQAINATTAAALTEAVGWAAVRFLERSEA